MAAAASVGLTVDAYVLLEWDQDIGALVEQVKRIIAPYPVRRLWLDAERPTDGRTPAEMVGLIQTGVDVCGAVPCGIYTGKGWWLASTDNSRSPPVRSRSNQFGWGELTVWASFYFGEL